MLPAKVRHHTLRLLRTGLERSFRHDTVRSVGARAVAEIERALTESGTYGGRYFGKERNPFDRMGLSGYERYDRDTSNANAIAIPIWKWFPVQRTLDVGCATGFVVEALRELGFDSWGTDLSYYAVEHPAQGAAGRLRQGDLMKGLPFADAEFELVTCLEVLEHMQPETIPTVLRELRRVTGKYLVATIPSFGPNDYGPGGWFDIKVRPEKLDEYNTKDASYTGPIPYDDLYRDADGEPIEGHLTMASFAWWTEQFTNAGFIRCGSTELSMHPDLARYELTEYWNLYVFRTPDADEPTAPLRSTDELAHWESNFKIADRPGRVRDYERLNEALVRNGREALPIPSSAR